MDKYTVYFFYDEKCTRELVAAVCYAKNLESLFEMEIEEKIVFTPDGDSPSELIDERLGDVTYGDMNNALFIQKRSVYVLNFASDEDKDILIARCHDRPTVYCGEFDLFGKFTLSEFV